MQDGIKRGRGGPRPGSGRKPKPAAERQSYRAMVSFTPSEAREVKRAAGQLPVGTWLRQLALRALKRRR